MFLVLFVSFILEIDRKFIILISSNIEYYHSDNDKFISETKITNEVSATRDY
jgi:hypothetical protein